MGMFHKRLSALLLVVSLAACGGGGGGTTGNTPTADDKFPVEAAFQKIFTTQATFSATASTGEQLSLTFSPTAQTAFVSGGAVSKTFNATQVVRRNGAILSNVTEKQFFTDAPLKMVAYSNRAVNANAVLPTTASAGAAGPFFEIPRTTAGRSNGINGSWSMEGVSSSSAFLCLTVQTGPGLSTLISFETTSIETFCFLIDKNGSASGFKADSASNSRATLNNPIVDRFSFR